MFRNVGANFGTNFDTRQVLKKFNIDYCLLATNGVLDTSRSANEQAQTKATTETVIFKFLGIMSRILESFHFRKQLLNTLLDCFSRDICSQFCFSGVRIQGHFKTISEDSKKY